MRSVADTLNATQIFFDDEEKIKSILNEYLYILSTAPQDNGKDPVIENYGYLFKKNSESIRWAGYLSTTSVYGDKKGLINFLNSYLKFIYFSLLFKLRILKKFIYRIIR